MESRLAPEQVAAEQLAAQMITAATAALARPRHPVTAAVEAAGEGPGLYALYGSAEGWAQLGLGAPPRDMPLYVGQAATSLARDLALHLTTGRTGQSAVRRTFAALLREHLGLRGLPRNPTKPERLAEVAVSEEDDAALTAWMATHVTAAVWPQPDECEALGPVEIALLKRWGPPLNLRDKRSTWGARVSATEKQMATDAREWARAQGHNL